MLARLQQFWARHRSLFWMLHSAWALATGFAVAILSHERYNLVAWVALSLVVTWASTLYFGRSATTVAAEGAEAHQDGTPPRLAHEVTSYVTRVMYQETLFFLLPFYAYSTVVRSPNVIFLALLGALAVLSCIDLIFDKWLRTKPVFGFAFFAIVAFAALNLVLPLLLGMRVRYATPLAALVAIAGAAPLARRTADNGRNALVGLVAAALAVLVVPVIFPALIPPVPLRLKSAEFSTGINQTSLVLTGTLRGSTSRAVVGRELILLVHVFAPSDLPSSVTLVWKRDGVVLRTSRDFEIVAHQAGFRVWDGWKTPPGGALPGRYEVVLQASGGRVVGVAKLRVID